MLVKPGGKLAALVRVFVGEAVGALVDRRANGGSQHHNGLGGCSWKWLDRIPSFEGSRQQPIYRRPGKEQKSEHSEEWHGRSLARALTRQPNQRDHKEDENKRLDVSH